MALFEKKRRTSQQKAQRAQMGILARLLGCAYLIYIMVQLLQSTRNEEATANMPVPVMIAIAVFFLLASAVIIVFTALEFLRGVKAGVYKSSSYPDDFAPDEAPGQDAGDAPAIEDGEAPDEDGGDADEDYEDGEYEDEDDSAEADNTDA